MLRPQKEALITSVSQSLDAAAGILFIDYTGMTVDEANAFRRKLQADGLQLRVIKNSLMSRALADKPYADISSVLKGSPTGVIFGFEDPVSTAKAAFDFAKDCPHLKVKGGVVDGQSVDAQGAEELSKMPSKVEVQGSIAMLAMSPGRNLAGQLKGPSGRVLGAIEALVKKLEEGAA